MGAIGNYIHWTYGGYVNHTGMRYGPFFDQLGQVMSHRERAFNNWKNRAKHSEIKDLEKQINADLKILNNLQKASQNNENYPIADEIDRALLEDISRYILDNRYFRIDLLAAAATEGLLSGNAYKAGLASTKGNSSASQRQQQIAAQVNSQLNEILNSVIGEIENVLMQQGVSQKTIENQISRTKLKIETFLKNLNAMSKTIDVQNSSTKAKLAQLLNNLAIDLKDSNSNIEVRNIIEHFVNGVSKGIAYDSNWKGMIAEAVTAASASKLSQLTAEKLIQMVKVIGDQKSNRVLIKDNFTPRLQQRMQEFVNLDNIKETDDYIMTTSGKQSDKVDVTISFKGNKPMNLSVKNYSPKAIKNTGFQNKTGNLLTLLQNENKNDFVNHYLNLVGIKHSSLQANRKEIVDLMKKIVVTKLITGYNTITMLENGSFEKMKAANVFAVYQNSKDGASVKLYTMKDILNSIFQDDKYHNINIPDVLYNSNKWQPNIEDRLANMVSQLKRQVSYTFFLSEIKES